MLLLSIVFFIISSAVMITSSTFLVKSLIKIARFLRISRFTAAFIIMAFATALPELFVGISSAVSKIPSLSLGNVIGSSMLHLTLLMGIFILLGNGIKVDSKKIGKDIYLALFSITLLIILFIIGNSLSRIDGAILLAFFALSYYRIFRRRKKFRGQLKRKKTRRLDIILDSFIFVLAFFVLLYSSGYVVRYASLIALNLQVPQLIVGLLLLSFSTTLPELTFGIRAIKMKHKEMVLGDLTGGVVTNLCLVVGLVAIIQPIKTSLLAFLISSLFLFVSAFVLITFMKSEKELKNGEGIALILIYVLFMIIESLTKI